MKAAFFLLQLSDAFITTLAVSAGFIEFNPIIRAVVANPILLVLVKIAIPAVIAWVVPGRWLIPAVVFLILTNAYDLFNLLHYTALNGSIW